MDIGILTPHRIRFRGPALIRRSRGALLAAGISVMERRPAADWGGQLQEYLVTVDARDSDDAIARVRAVVARHGPYHAFSANPEHH
jgi:hypothetical protein